MSNNTEPYFTVPQPRLIFLTPLYQADYPSAHKLSINFNRCLS